MGFHVLAALLSEKGKTVQAATMTGYSSLSNLRRNP